MGFFIGKNKIDNSLPEVYIIAELSANHNGQYEIAARTIEAMKNSGANAVKFQTYKPESMVLDLDDPKFKARKGTIWEGTKLFDLYKEGAMPYEWQKKLKKVAENLGMDCFSSPFDQEGVDFLESINVPAYKIASLEITDIPLIKYAARKGKPIILSSGISTISDIHLALDTIRKEGNEDIAVLKCTSAYPTPLEEVNLNTIPNIKDTFNVIPGLSDHTLGISVPVGAVALGAKIIEKHFILDKNLGGIDSNFSLDPQEFKMMVNSVRETEKALGEINYNLTEKMKGARGSARSLFFVKNIKKGEKIESNHIKSLRPNLGIHPQFFDEIIGKKANIDINEGTPVSWEILN